MARGHEEDGCTDYGLWVPRCMKNGRDSNGLENGEKMHPPVISAKCERTRFSRNIPITLLVSNRRSKLSKSLWDRRRQR